MSGTGERKPTAYTLGDRAGEALWFFGSLVVLQATAAQTGGRFLLADQEARRGFATPLHVQPDDDESFYVLDGECTFHLDGGEPIRTTTGAWVHIPAGTPHAFRVESERARLLVLSTEQHERFFRQAGEPARELVLPPEGPPDMEKVMAAAAAHGVEILGPPPDDA